MKANGNSNDSIVLAVTDEFFRPALAIFLSVQDGFEVVGQATNNAEVPPLCRQLRPDVLFLDLELHAADLVALVQAVLEEIPHLPIVVLAPRRHTANAQDVLQAGVSEFLPRDILGSDIAQAIHQANGHSR